MTNKKINNNGFEYVDLGLTSGTKWATMNVGANKPSDSGLYFQWGDTKGYTKGQVGKGKGKKEFSSQWSDYKWGERSNFSKYSTKGVALDLEDDAANANMGGDWHIPSHKQILELIDETTNEFTMQDGISGYLFTSKKDSSKTLFIPAAGIVMDGSIEFADSYAVFWASMLNMEYITCAQVYVYARLDYAGRCCGIPVRGVIG